MKDIKKISVCVIAYNEEKHLPLLFRDFINQTFPLNRLEIVLVDGFSTDRTKQLMNDFSKSKGDLFSKVIILDNPKRIQSAGWNIAIKASSGDIIIRIDAHSHIEKDFIEKNYNSHLTGEYITGGPRTCIIEDGSDWKKMLLMVENSLFGSSINSSRRDGQTKYVKTMFHAAYRREVFEKAGLFNEKLLRTEDNEEHYRIREAGYKFFFNPEIKSYQYARPTLKRMMRQKYGNGFWIGVTTKICPKCLSWYHYVPAFFVIAIMLTTLLSAFGITVFTFLLWGIYFAFTIIATVFGSLKEGFYIANIIAPIVFLLLHFAYGIGTVCGILFGKEYGD